MTSNAFLLLGSLSRFTVIVVDRRRRMQSQVLRDVETALGMQHDVCAPVQTALLDGPPASVAMAEPLASPQQRAASTYFDGNAYVGAGPGTGKTFVLVERLRALLARGVPPERILVLTFSRRAVHELRERIADARLGDATIDVRTFHGFAARVAGGGQARFRETRLLDGFSRRLLLEAAIARTTTKTLGATARASRTFAADLSVLLGDLSGLNDAAVARIAAAASPRLCDLLAIRAQLARERKAVGGGDLGDLVTRALAEAARPDSAANRWLGRRYSDVLVDEFQDTDREQLALLAWTGARVFAVGDEAQSIYRFRGASDAIVPYAIGRFAMRRFDLTESRRCPPAVCAFAAETPLPGLIALTSAHVDGPPVDVQRYGAIDDEAQALADAIEAELDAGRQAGQIAVLLRSFRPLGPLLVDELRERGIPLASVGREALLADVYVATLRAALALFASPGEPSRWRDLLASGPLGFDPLMIRATPLVTPLCLDSMLAGRLAALVPGNVLGAAAVATALLEAYAAWSDGDLGRAARQIVRRLGLLAAVVRDAAPPEVPAIAERLTRVCTGLAAAQRTARALGVASTPAALVARIDDLLAELALEDAGLAADVAGVRVLTIHAAKGLEFERVFLADAVQGRFPRAARPASFLDDTDRALLAANGVDGVTVAPDGAIREEASLWYVAVTRTRERLSMSFSERAANGDEQMPSAFVRARAPAQVTPVERMSLLVRALTAADAALHERVIAAGLTDAVPALAAFAHEGAAAFARCDQTPVRRTRFFSVSEATTWLECPRKVYYGRMLRLKQADSAAQGIGSLVHRVLHRFHQHHTAFDSADTPIDAWTDELLALRIEEWDAAAFAGAGIAEAAARAADAALRGYPPALRRYAEQHAFTIDALEAPIRIAAGAYSLEGRLDRLDHLADGTHLVIDYKRGAEKPSPAAAAKTMRAQWTKQEAAGLPRAAVIGDLPDKLDLQLAFYATALAGVAGVAKVYLGGAEKPEKRSGVAVMQTTPFGGDLEHVARAVLAELERDAFAPLATGTLVGVPTARRVTTCERCAFVSVCPGPAQDA